MQNRNKANIILASVFIALIIILVLKHTYRGNYIIELLAFVAEAAFIGGVADWFAVTAIFRKPLGFSWHTEIVPRNRELIIEKVSEIVGRELLSVEFIRSKIPSLNITENLVEWIKKNIDREALRKQVHDYLAENIDKLDRDTVAAEINRVLSDFILKDDVAEEIFKTVRTAVEKGKHKNLVNALLGKALEIASKSSTRDKILLVLRRQEHSSLESAGTGAFFVRILLNISRKSRYNRLEDIAALIQEQLVSSIKELMQPGNPIFEEFSGQVSDLFFNQGNTELIINSINELKNGLISRIKLYEPLRQLVSAAVGSDIYKNEIISLVSENFDKYILKIIEDEETRLYIDSVFGDMLEKIITREHYLIREITRETLESFSNDRLVRFIEEKAGNSLQWIRINGSIVGAAAGLLVFLFTSLVYDPYVVPVIQSLFNRPL